MQIKVLSTSGKTWTYNCFDGYTAIDLMKDAMSKENEENFLLEVEGRILTFSESMTPFAKQDITINIKVLNS